MKLKQAARLSAMRKQGGFTLPQMAIVVLLLSIVMAYAGVQYAQETVRKSRDDRARLVGMMLSTVNDATKTYSTTFFTQIQQGQSITRNGYTVPPARILEPTTADLNGLGFLASKAVNPVIYNGQSIGVKVQLTVDTSSGCTVPTCNLPFQVTTTVPLRDPGNNTVDIRRATIAATTASPGNAGVSMPVSFGGNPNVFVTSNGTQTGTNPGGVVGLVSVSNGYDSSGFFEFDRRDGSLPRTGDVNMQDTAGAKHNINNAGGVNSETVISSGRVTTGEYIDIQSEEVEGSPCEKTGLISKTVAGKLLSCQSGKWTAMNSQKNSWGGKYLFSSNSRTCIGPNPMTGGCSCPPGYKKDIGYSGNIAIDNTETFVAAECVMDKTKLVLASWYMIKSDTAIRLSAPTGTTVTNTCYIGPCTCPAGTDAIPWTATMSYNTTTATGIVDNRHERIMFQCLSLPST